MDNREHEFVVAARLWPTAVLWIFFLSWFFCGCLPCWALEACEVGLVVNDRCADGLEVAEHYCRLRGVPREHIVRISVADRERVSRAVYEKDIAGVVREWLKRQENSGKIKCLVTVFGVPLKVDGVSLSAGGRAWRGLLVEQLDERFGQLDRLTGELERLSGGGGGGTIDSEVAKVKLPRVPAQREKKARELLGRSQAAAERASKAAAGRLSSVDADRISELLGQLSGMQGLARGLSSQLAKAVGRGAERLGGKLAELRVLMQRRGNELDAIDGKSLDMGEQRRRYELIYELVGLGVLCKVLLNDRWLLGDEESNASVDSELSMVLCSKYMLSAWQYNALCVHDIGVARPAGWDALADVTLMVSRLDGPDAEIAKGLVDRAVAAERLMLRGNAYIDSRGIQEKTSVYGAYGYYDEQLRGTARLLRRQTGLNVELDVHGKLFDIGACPDTTLYCGWYSVRKYVDSFEFGIGSVGYHIASFEAETLGRGDPNSNVWCKRMLENGITATFGPVAEPYLHSFPNSETFFSDLISRQYCLVECFYRSKPFNSWMMTLIGDPLYKPRYAKKRGFVPTN